MNIFRVSSQRLFPKPFHFLFDYSPSIRQFSPIISNFPVNFPISDLQSRCFVTNSSSSADEPHEQPDSLRNYKGYNVIDRLDPKKWRLIYFNTDHEKFGDHEWVILGGIGIWGLLGGIIVGVYFILIFPSIFLADDKLLQQSPHQNMLAEVFLILALLQILTHRWRRLRVLRIYEPVPGSRIVSKSAKNDENPLRFLEKEREKRADYCIVWKSSIMHSKRFYYKKSETKDACERSDVLGMFLSNFRARGRRWHVYRKFFENRDDYVKVRVP